MLHLKVPRFVVIWVSDLQCTPQRWYGRAVRMRTRLAVRLQGRLARKSAFAQRTARVALKPNSAKIGLGYGSGTDGTVPRKSPILQSIPATVHIGTDIFQKHTNRDMKYMFYGSKDISKKQPNPPHPYRAAHPRCDHQRAPPNDAAHQSAGSSALGSYIGRALIALHSPEFENVCNVGCGKVSGA